MNIRGAVDNYDRETSTYIVAYLDILGVTNKMQQKNEFQMESLNKLYNLYRHIIDLSDSENGIKKYSDIKFRIFSDNIIIAKKISKHKDERVQDIICLLNCVSNFSCAAVGDGVAWLLRGGITIGDFYINDTIVWGQALLRSYELEDKIAIYPRIIIDKNIYSELPCDLRNEWVSLDFDGLSFLNYMNIWHFAGKIVTDGFEKIKSEARRADGTYSDRIYQKLYWHMNYINSELDRKNERKDKKYRLTL